MMTPEESSRIFEQLKQIMPQIKEPAIMCLMIEEHVYAVANDGVKIMSRPQRDSVYTGINFALIRCLFAKEERGPPQTV